MGEEEKKVETPAETSPEVKPAAKSSLVVRVLLICILVILAIFAIRWYGVKADLARGQALYDEFKYEEAIPVLDKVCKSSVSFLRLRKVAQVQKAFCEMELALMEADKERSYEGYTKAVKAIEEARRLGGGSAEIERRLEEYTDYKTKFETAPESMPKAGEPAPDTPAPEETPAAT